jgi:hypothetical protein
MTDWHDTMVDRPETDGALYVTGWTISGLAVLGAILMVWVLGNLAQEPFVLLSFMVPCRPALKRRRAPGPKPDLPEMRR